MEESLIWYTPLILGYCNFCQCRTEDYLFLFHCVDHLHCLQNWGNYNDLVILWNQAYPNKVFWLRSAFGNGWVYIINQQCKNMNWVLQKTFRFLVFGDLKISVTFSFTFKISSFVLIVVDCKCQYWRTINNIILRCWGFDLYLI